MIPLSRPDITDLEIQAVCEVLKTSSLALGPRLQEFEEKMARFHGRKHAIAVNSGTSGLHLAMIAAGLKEDDEVITSPFSFVASTNCILYENGSPVFVDIDKDTWNLDIDLVEKAITPKTKGILPIHVFGLPCNMEALSLLAKKHGLWIVEDACEAIGAYSGKTIAGKESDLAVLAFYPNKQITTGEGGLVLTDNDEYAETMRSVRNQGRASGSGWLNHQRLGYNYRMSDIHAALGLVQLQRIDEILKKRAQVASWYENELKNCDLISFQHVPENMTKSWFVFVVKLNNKFNFQHRNAILELLKKSGISCNNYFTPIHLQPFIKELLGTDIDDFPITESVAERTIALPFYTNLSKQEVQEVSNKFIEIAESVCL